MAFSSGSPGSPPSKVLGGSGFELKNKDQAIIGLAIAGFGLILLIVAVIMML